MSEHSKLPLFLLTGFVGSGKTRLLRGWLDAPDFAGTLTLLDGLGEDELDCVLLTAGENAPVSLAGGCACCDGDGDLVALLERLFFDRHYKNIAAFSRVVIEASGLADPWPILDRLRDSEILRDAYDPPIVIAALAVPAGCAQHRLIARQIGSAQIVILTQTDLATPEACADMHAQIACLNPGAIVLQAGQATVLARDVLAAAACVAPARPAPTQPVYPAWHARGLASVFVPLQNAVSADGLRMALTRAITDHGDALLRVRGLVQIVGAGLHGVQATRSTGLTCEPVKLLADDSRTGLTLIARAPLVETIGASMAARLRYRGLALTTDCSKLP